MTSQSVFSGCSEIRNVSKFAGLVELPDRSRSSSYVKYPFPINRSSSHFSHRLRSTNKNLDKKDHESRFFNDIVMERIIYGHETDKFQEKIKTIWEDNWTTRLGLAYSLMVALTILCISQNIFNTLDPYSFSSLATEISHKNYKLLSTYIIWFMSLWTGFATEIFIGTQFIDPTHLQWPRMWVFAQLIFSMFIMLGFTAGTPFGIPFAVLGLFKCGFPEIVCYFHRCFSQGVSKIGFWADFVTGVGLVIHHSSALYICVALNLQYYILDETIALLGWILMAQQVFVISKYFHNRFYVIVIVLLETWFQYEAITRIPNTKGRSKQLFTIYMLISHWLIWIGVLLEFFVERYKSTFSESTELVDENNIVIHPSVQPTCSPVADEEIKKPLRQQGSGEVNELDFQRWPLVDDRCRVDINSCKSDPGQVSGGYGSVADSKIGIQK
eukprot:UN25784